jgi:hypothetical protein
MPVFSKAEQDQVDPGSFGSDSIRDSAHHLLVLLRGSRRVQVFPLYPIDVIGVDSQGLKQRSLGHTEIAFSMFRWNTTFISEKEKYMGPIESRSPLR